MSDPQPKILSLNPGTEELGFAVVELERLLCYGACPLDEQPSGRLPAGKAVAAAERAVDDFSPDRLAVAKVETDGSHGAVRLNVISDRIRAMAARKELPVDRVARAAACKAVTGDPEASRKELVDTLADAFPQLQTFLPDEPSDPDRDAADVFEAVGLALAADRARDTGDRRDG